MKTPTVQTVYLSADDAGWDTYVHRHPKARCYHLSAWLKAIQNSYGHPVYHLAALQSGESGVPTEPPPPGIETGEATPECPSTQSIIGVLPLVHLKHFFFENALISTAFSDYGGILADNEAAEQSLLQEAVRLGRRLKAAHIELRQINPLPWLPATDEREAVSSSCDPMQPDPRTLPSRATRPSKVTLLLDLPESPEALMDSFKSKLRSQIRKPLKEGLEAQVGGLELLNDFYRVFTINMKHLGSPVHSKRLMQNILTEFKDKAGIVVVYKEKQALAAGVVVGFRDTLMNPWASSLREYSRFSPNMLLYWAMLDFACKNGFKFFDFGRSSPDEGTYKFKRQWGSKSVELNWHRIVLNGPSTDSGKTEKEKFSPFIELWKRLPLYVTRILGPPIRKHIGL